MMMRAHAIMMLEHLLGCFAAAFRIALFKRLASSYSYSKHVLFFEGSHWSC
jgi:hypothetical protein